MLRLGYGVHQKLVRASITGDTPHLAVEIVGDKTLTKSLLAAASIPVPAGRVVQDAQAAVVAAQRLGRNVVTKPVDGNHGRGVSIGLNSDAEVRRGFERAANHSRKVIVEEQFMGRDYRVLIIAGEVVAVAERVPAHVIGDGTATIAELIEQLNADPRRGKGHEKVMTRVVVDDQPRDVLAKQSLVTNDVPVAGQRIILRETANLSTGGEAIDRTEEIHPDNRRLMQRAARVVGLDIAGIDLITPDIFRPIRANGGGIVEINAAPGFRMHLEPSSGDGRNVAKPVIDMLFPRGTRSKIPIIAAYRPPYTSGSGCGDGYHHPDPEVFTPTRPLPSRVVAAIVQHFEVWADFP